MTLLRNRGLKAAALGLLTLTLLSQVSLAATDEERAAARNLADKARGAFEGKRYKEAIDLFIRAETLVHSPIHLLFLARAYVASGQLVRAHEALLKASRETLDATSPPSRVQAVHAAAIELPAVRARLAELTVDVSGAEHAHLTLDGNAISDVLVGVPMPVDPGNHKVEAKAEGFLHAFREFNLAEGEKERVALQLVRDPSAALELKPAEPSTEAAPEQTQPAQETKSGAEVGPQERKTGFLVASIGGFVLAAAGGGFGTYKVFQARAEEDSAAKLNRQCGGTCIKDIGTHVDKANNFYEAATLPYIIGGAGLAGGATFLILYLLSGEDKPAAASLSPWLTPSAFGVAGRF